MRAIVLSSLFLRVLSGKRDPLPGLPPLRTVLASFPAHGSSLDMPPSGAGISTLAIIRSELGPPLMIIQVSVQLTFSITTSVFSWFQNKPILFVVCHSRPGARQPIPPITGGPLLLAPSYSLHSWGFLTVALPLGANGWGFPRSTKITLGI
jgi:hypothetical protein